MNALAADWLGACRRTVEGMREMFGEHATTNERAVYTGLRGEGGDRTLVIDQAAEERAFAQLEELHSAGHRFTAVSEERGEVDFGDPGVLVVIDPIDGSLNAKRGVPQYAFSLAVASGGTMADVDFGYVYDFGTGEEWSARLGQGAFLGSEPLDRSLHERRTSDGRLEIVGLESADPRWVAASLQGLLDATHRLRVVGTIAVSLCQVAAARFDGMVSLRRCRAVDAAAGQLIVREAGGVVAFPGFDDLTHPLDVQPHAPVVAARSAEALAVLSEVPG